MLEQLAAWFPLDDIETWKNYIHQYGYWTIFGGILLENAGIPLPGETITLTGGFLAGNGELNYWGVLVVAFAGAVIGDNCGYWLGVKGGWPLMLKVGRLFRIREAQLLKVRDEFQRNADKAVLFGRFLAVLRVFAGPLAGIAQMPYRRFVMFNLLGALAWSSIMVTLAFFVGQILPLETIVTRTLQFAVLALVIFCSWVVISRWLEHRLARQMDPAESSEIN